MSKRAFIRHHHHNCHHERIAAVLFVLASVCAQAWSLRNTDLHLVFIPMTSSLDAYKLQAMCVTVSG